MDNPFKFGSIVDGQFFTNRTEEIARVESILKSSNHLIILSPRRYGKTSLIVKVVNTLNRPYIIMDLQVITSVSDFASHLLKKIYKIYPLEKLKETIRNFRIMPVINMNPSTGEIDVFYKPAAKDSDKILLEDVLNLIEKLGSSGKKPVIVFDEFQDIVNIGKGTDKQLRSVIQYHKNINYVFLGSQESLMREIFEKKKSPFYHFGYLFPLSKIPFPEFYSFLTERFKSLVTKPEYIATEILNFTKAHPYYTQKLAFSVWEILNNNKKALEPVKEAVKELLLIHDVDYERLWNTFNRTDMKMIIALSESEVSPFTNEFSMQTDLGAVSTRFSSIKRLAEKGIVIKNDKSYEIDDPFFSEWIRKRRAR